MSEYPQSGGEGSWYRHQQIVPATLWTIAHNFGREPVIQTVDSAGREFIGDVRHIDANTVTVEFSAAFGGEAYLAA